jgi:DNA-directed RNA polymerase specialized sigma24 family protein
MADFSDQLIDRDLLRQALGTLDPEWRAIVVLHYFLEYPLPRWRAWSDPLGTAKSRLHSGDRDPPIRRRRRSPPATEPIVAGRFA